MKSVNYEDVPKLCEQLLVEIESTGVTFVVMKNGKPFVQMEPVDEETKSLFAARRNR